MATCQDLPSKLTKYVLFALKKQKRPLTDVAIDAKVPLAWLDMLYKGKIKNPGVNRIEKLYEHFSGKKLNV